MGSSLNILLTFGLMSIICIVNALDTCNTKTQSDAEASGWDPRCSVDGKFKSKSFCYKSDTGSYIYRYDYVHCVYFDGRYLTYRKNCSGPLVPNEDGTDVFNRFDDVRKMCTLTPPPPPTTTTTLAP